MFPHLHSQSFQSKMSLKATDDGVEDVQMANKINIIKELEQKINQLESGVSSRGAGQDYISGIEKEIRGKFQNYYTFTQETQLHSLQ